MAGEPAGIPRRAWVAAALGTALLAACGRGPGQPASSSGPRVTATIATDLDTPWSLAFLPDGTALVSERDTALIRRISPGVNQPLAQVPGVVHGGEGGLLGLALEPGPGLRLFAYFTAADGNRVSRFDVDGDLGAEEPLLTGIPAAGIHNGGRIAFGPDGHLYIGTGDAGRREAAQDPDSLSGKILRVTVDGQPAPGNPFGTEVYSLGHRNVQGLAWGSDGRMWASELGPDRDDELNLIRPGVDYGWPRGTGTAPGAEAAIHVWPSTADASPSGLAVVGAAAYVACLRGQRMWRLPLPAAGTEHDGAGLLPGAAPFMRGTYGRLRDVVAAPDGSLWVATNEGTASRVLKVEV